MTIIETKKQIADAKPLKLRRLEQLRELVSLKASDDIVIRQVILVADAVEELIFLERELKELEQTYFKIGEIE